MATTSIPPRWKYDVFVSFRGEDIRKNFMDHLFNDFKQKGIHAFRDDRELPKGEEVSPHLCKAIEESRFLIVIFSKNYASSSWCLRELVKILECKQTQNPKHEIRIVFYDVKPDVVRKEKRSYEEAFGKHEVSNRAEVGKWKEALSMAADLSGFDLQDMTNGYEYKFIDCISKDILKKLCDGPLHVGENLVGMDFHFEKLDMSCFVGSNKVNMIGICGISGIGKTTLAKAIYNMMYVHFEGSCFCDDVKKQQDLTQLEALAGSASWFCPGSLIIFTCKDKQLLRSHRVDEIHDMYFLNEDQSLKLLCSYAFKEKELFRGFDEAAEKVVKYVQGHPLALKVLGRFLYGKTVGQWVSELDQLKVHPNKKIQQVLRLSYDGLNLHQQNILLDFPCSFNGVNRDFAASVLDGWVSSRVCKGKGAIAFWAGPNLVVWARYAFWARGHVATNCRSKKYSLRMHDLIQAMAREIVREESNTPGNRSRLWANPSEIYNILSEKKATQAENRKFEDIKCKDKQLLRSHRVDEIHDMYFLNEDQSLELLRSYAFKEKESSRGFEEAVEKVVKYVQGHPLALKVLGRFLYGKSVGQWVSELNQLKVHPNEEIQRVLRLSYDGLNLHQQNILLDIACSFIGVNRDFAASILDGCNFFADTNIQVLVDKSLITISSKNSLLMHDLIQAMAREIVREESNTPGNRSRLWINPSEIYNILSEKKATQAVEILDIQQKKSSQKFDIDGKAFAQMKNLRILKLPNDDAVNFSGRLDCLSNKLRLLYWHGCPFKLLPSYFYPENVVVIDLSYSSIKQLWTTPKCLRRLKIMKLGYCCNLTTTPHFSEITSLEELDLEGCVNLVTLHPFIVLNLSGCLNVNQPFEALWSRWWTFGLLSKQHPERPVSLAGLYMLKSLNLSYCNFSILPGSLSQLSHLRVLFVDGCKKLEVLPELPPSVWNVYACDCTSLREVLGSSKDSYKRRFNFFRNCPNLFKNVTVDSEGCVSKTQSLDSSITSQGFIHRLSAFLGYFGFQTNRCDYFLQDNHYSDLDIVYHGNSMPEWFTNRSRESHVKVELPSDWCYDKNFRGFGTFLVFKRKKPFKRFGRYTIKNFDGASIAGNYSPLDFYEFLKREVIGTQDSYMIWLRYRRMDRWEWGWKNAKNFVTFFFEENNEDVEVKECGVRLICD
ncbi:NB-ARC domains-containing protein [Tanacetum coccineum]